MLFQAFSGLDKEISLYAELTGNTSLDAVMNTQFLVQIGVFTAVPMIMGFILESGLLKVSPSNTLLCHDQITWRGSRTRLALDLKIIFKRDSKINLVVSQYLKNYIKCFQSY